FNDRNFRQAVNHAINRKAMVANHFKGLGYPSFTMLSPVSPFFNENLKGFEPDIEYCLKLLAESGFKKDTEGQLVDSKSNRVEFDLVTSSGGTFFSTISNMFIEDMKKLGIKVNFEEINFNILMDRVQVACNWQAGIYGLSGGDPFEPHSSANIFASNARRHLFDQRQPDKSGNIPVTDARAWEKRIDQLYSQGASTFDNTKRKAIYNELQKIIYDEAPFIYLVDAMNIIGARNTIKNYNPTRLSQLTIGVHNIEELYKEPGKPEQKQ
ncbi:MAG: hypothetical protein K8F91_04450, partial [Candidatus Obscuribacterales bacterium]|nr:hypothetical protein [Candidatus Obscuribacterales bacterium]